jgi:hypothetical protein
MTEAIFGLVGVIIGGLLQAATSWLVERRRQSWAVRKAARLLAVDLARCGSVLDYASKYPCPQQLAKLSWGEVNDVVEATVARWRQTADVFAGTLPQQEWDRLVASVRLLEGEIE